MPRWTMVLLAAGAVCLQAQEPQEQLKRERPRPSADAPIATPPEEDETVAGPKYAFNPLQSQKEVRVGDFYFTKKSYRAAALRYREATRWNEKNSQAWLRLAEAAEKSKDLDVVKEAYAKYLSLEPDARNASGIRKKLDKLK